MSPHPATLLAAALVASLATSAMAAPTVEDARLAARLDAETAAAVSGLVEEARAAGLPTEPLVAKALEGASKQAPGPRIAEAVRRYAASLGAARDALGRESRAAEIVAGAGALLAGIPADSLARLRAARPGRSLVVPLVVLADLIARRVPAPTASATIIAASRAGARDVELLRLRERVEQDIRAGASPVTAATLRGRALVTGAEGARRAPAVPTPGGPR